MFGAPSSLLLPSLPAFSDSLVVPEREEDAQDTQAEGEGFTMGSLLAQTSSSSKNKNISKGSSDFFVMPYVRDSSRVMDVDIMPEPDDAFRSNGLLDQTIPAEEHAFQYTGLLSEKPAGPSVSVNISPAYVFFL